RADQLEQLLRHELERASRTRALEEADRTLELRRLGSRLLEEASLEVRERGMRHLAEARRELLDPPAGEVREVLGGATERRERDTARLVRKRDGHLGPTRERLEDSPFRSGQVLEAVGEEVVEGPDRACEERTGPLEQLPLDALDVRPAWHDQKRLALERSQVTVEQELDLAGVRGPDDEAEGHPPIVVPALDVLPVRKS